MRRVVAVSVDKVQTFMYKCIKDKTQKEQQEANTRKSVISASIEVKNTLRQNIYKYFDINDDDIIHNISGKIFFYADKIQNIDECFKNLYKLYYYTHKGNIQIRYTYDELDIEDKTKIVQHMSKKLKSYLTTNKIIKDNADILFSIPNEIDFTDINKQSPFDNSTDDEYDYYLKGLDNIITNKNDDLKKGSIAIIKADINNMGAIMNKITGEKYFLISNLLEENISLNVLHKYLKEKNAKACPFYVAGDDIFIATSIKDVFNAVKAINALIESLNKEIKNIVNDNELNIVLKVSIGIQIVASDMPIRYYYDTVEEQLDNAKTKGKEKEKEEEGKSEEEKPYDIVASICFNDTMFYVYQNKVNYDDKKDKKIKKQFDWRNLQQDISNIQRLRQLSNNNDSLSRSFMHKLLETVEMYDFQLEKRENQIKLFNAIIYQLLPNSLSIDSYKTIECKIELYIKAIIMRNLLKTKDTKTNEKVIDINTDIIKRFKSMLRLYIVFNDNRFVDDTEQKNSESKDDIFSNLSEHGYSIDEMRSLLFTKPCKYIYSMYESNYMFKHFINIKTVEIYEELKYNKIKRKKISYYQTLNLNNSMFFKIKNILNEKTNKDVSINKIADMIDNVTKFENNHDINCNAQKISSNTQINNTQEKTNKIDR